MPCPFGARSDRGGHVHEARNTPSAALRRRGGRHRALAACRLSTHGVPLSRRVGGGRGARGPGPRRAIELVAERRGGRFRARATRPARRQRSSCGTRRRGPHPALPRRPGARPTRATTRCRAYRDARSVRSSDGLVRSASATGRAGSTSRGSKPRRPRRASRRSSSARAARRAPRGDRPPDAHLAGLQPPRRRRGRSSRDSWYGDWKRHTVRLGRPFLNRGVPYHFRRYDLPFLHWLHAGGKRRRRARPTADLDERRRRRRACASPTT